MTKKVFVEIIDSEGNAHEVELEVPFTKDYQDWMSNVTEACVIYASDNGFGFESWDFC